MPLADVNDSLDMVAIHPVQLVRPLLFVCDLFCRLLLQLEGLILSFQLGQFSLFLLSCLLVEAAIIEFQLFLQRSPETLYQFSRW